MVIEFSHKSSDGHSQRYGELMATPGKKNQEFDAKVMIKTTGSQMDLDLADLELLGLCPAMRLCLTLMPQCPTRSAVTASYEE